MTPAQRAITALTMGIPDEVPTFELEYQLEELVFGRKFVPNDFHPDNYSKLTQLQKDKLIDDTAEFFAHVYNTLDYSIIPAYGPGDMNSYEYKTFIKRLRERIGNTRLLGCHGDGTFSIPDGNGMYDFSYRLVDDLDGVIAQAEQWCVHTIEANHRKKEAGMDVLFLCSDYCYNVGPFVSPEMFAIIVTPFLARIIEAARKDGLYAIKHTDGNIMPILDQLVQCNPHALHSIDPMAGVDIKVVKEMVGDKVCLCGNVHCAAMQTGTDEEVIASAEYCLTHGKKNGGYIFCTSNVPFRGMPPERYELILNIWKKMRAY